MNRTARHSLCVGGAAVAIALGSTAWSAEGSCFDFSRPILEPLRPPVPAAPDGSDVHVFGRRADGPDWAAGRATIQAPIEHVYGRILEFTCLKDMTKTTVNRHPENRPGFLAFQVVDIAVRVRALVVKKTIEWREAWGFALTEGTPHAPRRIVASYQKVSGTGYIKHLCGSYVMTALDAGRTDLAFYEEVRASRRNAEDTRNMHAGILRNLRKP